MNDGIINELVVVKRSGQRVSFNGTKVALAIKKGFDSVYEEYDEKEVNEIILKFHDDFCTIRRDMISEHIMEREGNIYMLK